MRRAVDCTAQPGQEKTMRTEYPLFLIGKDSRGRWVAQDRNGLRGGLFVSRADALKFALFENGNRPEAVIPAIGVLELDMSSNAFAPVDSHPDADLPRAA